MDTSSARSRGDHVVVAVLAKHSGDEVQVFARFDPPLMRGIHKALRCRSCLLAGTTPDVNEFSAVLIHELIGPHHLK